MSNRRERHRCEDNCLDHMFSLTADPSALAKYNMMLTFCPKQRRGALPPEATHPIFNMDQAYYTNGFILGVDLRNHRNGLEEERMGFNKLIKESLEKKNQFKCPPRPNSKHQNCSVCKVRYQNYYLHIQDDQHLEAISSARFNLDIHELCERYRELWDGAQERADLMPSDDNQSQSEVKPSGEENQYSGSVEEEGEEEDSRADETNKDDEKGEEQEEQEDQENDEKFEKLKEEGRPGKSEKPEKRREEVNYEKNQKSMELILKNKLKKSVIESTKRSTPAFGLNSDQTMYKRLINDRKQPVKVLPETFPMKEKVPFEVHRERYFGKIDSRFPFEKKEAKDSLDPKPQAEPGKVENRIVPEPGEFMLEKQYPNYNKLHLSYDHRERRQNDYEEKKAYQFDIRSSQNFDRRKSGHLDCRQAQYYDQWQASRYETRTEPQKKQLQGSYQAVGEMDQHKQLHWNRQVIGKEQEGKYDQLGYGQDFSRGSYDDKMGQKTSAKSQSRGPDKHGPYDYSLPKLGNPYNERGGWDSHNPQMVQMLGRQYYPNQQGYYPYSQQGSPGQLDPRNYRYPPSSYVVPNIYYSQSPASYDGRYGQYPPWSYQCIAPEDQLKPSYSININLPMYVYPPQLNYGGFMPYPNSKQQ